MPGKSVYLDCAAAMPPDPEVLNYYLQELQSSYANQEAIHHLAYLGRKALKNAGEKLSAALTSRSDYQVIFAATATDIFRIISSFPEFTSAAASKLEHPALLANLRNNCEKFSLLDVERNGCIVPQQHAENFSLTAIHHVQSELGVIQNPDAVFKPSPVGCKMLDAVQSAGKLPLYTQADITVVSGVKFGSPCGAAALLHPESAFTGKLLEHAEKYRHKDYSCGRISVAAATTLAFAAEKQVSKREEDFQKISFLNDMCRNFCAGLGIKTTIPSEIPTSPYILHLLLPGQESAVIVRTLSASGVYVASGSACSAESDTPSPALTAIGLSKKAAYRALRISFGKHNSEEDVIFFLSELKKALKNY